MSHHLGQGSHPAPDSPIAAHGTPLAWRIESLGILVGGAIVGRLAGRSKLGAIVLAAPVGILAGWALAVTRAGRRRSPRQSVMRPSATPEVTVVVPARNEASVVAGLVRDLVDQDHRDARGKPQFEVVVVDDRSTDGTGAVVCREAAALGLGSVFRIVRLEGATMTDGKGAALAVVPPALCREVIVVLDADARIAPDFLRLAASHVTAGAPALQARRRMLGSGSGTLARLQADEQSVDARMQIGRWARGGCSEFRGNGMIIQRDELVAAGGWRSGPLTEDLDLSSRLAARGRAVAWVDVDVWETPVEGWRDLWGQRLRWAEGSIRRYAELGPQVLASRELTVAARLDYLLYAGQLLVPPLAAGLVATELLNRRVDRAVLVLAALGTVAFGLAYESLGQQGCVPGRPLDRGERTARAAGVAAFESLWLVAVPAALCRIGLRRGPLRFVKMPHRPMPFAVAAR